MPLPKQVPAGQTTQAGVISETENERLRRDIFRPDMDKFELFIRMLRNNKMYNRVKITHK